MSALESSWWRAAVVYQIYPRSFADSNGDGVGDLPGVTSRLEHVAALGADAVWLTPFQRSPQADHGYDVSDYLDVDPLFGTLADFDALVARAHDLALRVIVDLVPNHCSSAHPAFQAALAAGPGSPERARFHFARGRGPRGDEPPNNWPSVFGGPAWTRVTEPDGLPGEWYLHLYAPEQPDWNWRHPATGEILDAALCFWLDRGADGVRIDVAHGLYKADGLPDLVDTRVEPMRLRGNPLACDQEEVHEVYRRWRAIADAYEPERVLVGEVNLLPARAERYVRADELHQAFAFAFLAAPVGRRELAGRRRGAAGRRRPHRLPCDLGRGEPRRRAVAHPLRDGGAGSRPRPGRPAHCPGAPGLGLPLPRPGAGAARGRRPAAAPTGPGVAALRGVPGRRPRAAAVDNRTGRRPRLLLAAGLQPLASRPR